MKFFFAMRKCHLIILLAVLGLPVRSWGQACIATGEIIYISTFTGSQILKILDSCPATVSVVYTNTTANPAFLPEGIAVGPDNKIYVCDSIASRIWRVDPTTNTAVKIYDASTATAPNNPHGLEGPSFNSAGDLFMNSRSDSGTPHGIWKIAGPASIPDSGPFAPVQVFNNGFFGEGTVFDGADNLDLVDSSGNRVLQSSPPYSTENVLAIGSGLLNAPIGIAANPQANSQIGFGSNDIFVANASAVPANIKHFSSTGAFVSTYATFTSPDFPAYMQFDPNILFVVTVQNGQGGHGKVWRIPPSAAPATPVLVVDLNSVFLSGTVSGLLSDRAVGLTVTQTTQTQTSPPQNFNSSTTNTTVPFIFSPTPGKYEQHNEIFPKGGNITCPIGCANGQLQVQDTKTPISNAMWPLYVGGTPWGPSKLFPVASNGGTDQGSMYTIQCFDNTHPPVPGQCPFPTNPGPGNHVSARLIFDLPAGVQPPAIAPGTTVAAIHYPPINPPWAPSNTLPNVLCRNAMLATSTSPVPVDCPGENTLVGKDGSTNAPLSNTRNGSYALVYNVPMLCSAWKVNGMQVHNGCVQDNSTFFVSSASKGGLTFNFLVRPAQLPPGFTIENIASIQRTGGNTVTVTTTSNLPGTWTNGTTLAIKPGDTVNFPPVSAVISSVTANSFQYTQTGSNVTGNPATGTVDDANGWVAAPVNKLFYTFDPFPGPDYPNIVLVQNDENLNDLDNCFAGSSNCPVAGTSPAQPGTSSTQSVEFATTTPLPVPADGLYDLQVSEADTARNRGMNIQLLTDLSAMCPNPSPSDANTPAGGWTPPCYKAALWFAKIGVDNTAPTVSTPMLTPPPVNGTYAVGQSVTASVNCVDVISGGVASSVVMCGKDSFTPAPTPPAGTQTSVNSSGNPVPTSTRGKQTFTLSAKDQAGNVGTSPGASFCVGYTITSVDRNGVVGFTQPVDNPGPGPQAVVNVVGSSQAIPLSLTVVDCNGVPVSNLDLVGSTNVGTAKTVVLSATNAPSGTCATAVIDNSISTAAAGSSGWQILGNGVYDYNWKPMAPVGSCLAFSVNLGDNIPHTAYFNVVRK